MNKALPILPTLIVIFLLILIVRLRWMFNLTKRVEVSPEVSAALFSRRACLSVGLSARPTRLIHACAHPFPVLAQALPNGKTLFYTENGHKLRFCPTGFGGLKSCLSS
jgi:hypothetical protein